MSVGHAWSLRTVLRQRQSIIGFGLLLKIKKAALSPALEKMNLTGLHVKCAAASCNLITTASLFARCGPFENQTIRAPNSGHNLHSERMFKPWLRSQRRLDYLIDWPVGQVMQLDDAPAALTIVY